MATQRVHVERLIGTCVRDAGGRPVGRIEEIKAELCDGGECRVTEFQLGSRALWKRLDIAAFALSILAVFGADKYPITHRIPWDQMDLSDPTRPRLRCRAEELTTVEPFHNPDDGK